MRTDYGAYEDGSSCDEEFNDAKADADGESYLQKAWDIEQLIEKSKLLTTDYPYDAEELLEELCHEMDRKGIDLDDHERLQVIQDILDRRNNVHL